MVAERPGSSVCKLRGRSLVCGIGAQGGVSGVISLVRPPLGKLPLGAHSSWQCREAYQEGLMETIVRIMLRKLKV